VFEIKAPDNFKLITKLVNGKSIFLAGSIEMGKAENWQQRFAKELQDKPVILLNPRRDDWDSSWIQSIKNSNFREQVEWELDALEHADYIIVYFDPKTQSPITLLEVGLHAKSNKMYVCCPEGFYRKGNIEIVCNKYNIPLFENFDDLVNTIKQLG